MNITDILNSAWFQKKNPGWNVKSLSGANLSWADLSRADLGWADLSGADLSRADLSGANLSVANLRGANLRGADLSEANLRGADLSEANLSWVDLSRADLGWANLSMANLSRANLSEASLSEANLSEANLSRANLSRANLSRANLSRANLSWVDLSKSWNVPNLPETIIVPKGTLCVYKKTCEGIVELEIPKYALRSNATSRKCRASEAIVTKLPQGHSVCHSIHDHNFTYCVGETVRPTQPFDMNRWNECGSGIHFFLTSDEAEQY